MRRISTLLLCGLVSFSASAQRYYGIATSNWSGTNSIYLNPANVADSRHRFTIDLSSFNFGLDNDEATLNSTRIRKGDNLTVGSLLLFNTDTKTFNLTAPYLEVRGPGFMWSINKKMGIALTSRVRIYNQFQDFDRSLYGIIVDESNRNINGDFAVKTGKFNWNLHAWSEIGATYGAVLMDQGTQMLKGGITARYLRGIGYVNMNAFNIDGYYYSSQDSLHINNSDVTFSSNFIKNENQLSGALSGRDIANYFLDNRGGHGFGLDLGLVYEWRPDNNSFKYDMDGVKGIDDNSVNRYKLRVSAAITDIGAINYKDNNKMATVRGTGSVIGSEVNMHRDNFQDFREYMNSRGLDVDSTGSIPKVKMPTALQLSVDYNFGSDCYANLAYNGNLVDRFVPGNIYYSQLTLTPRYDKRWISFGLPITYNFFSKTMKIGAGIRLADFFIGSDDMLAYFGGKGQTGANFYLGAFVPFDKSRPRDSDNDGVSDKKDNCRFDKGTWENKGCPILDKDNDGVLDSVDKCPDIAGSTTAMGCPDADLDSVADASDDCPQEAGLVQLHGCPDRDGDGIADKDDDCPDAPGIALMHGCPDADGDGIADNKDACPDEPGTALTQGCPDKDGDGIADKDDACPDKMGTAATQGCPDTDGDGIADKDDACPDLRGTALTHGCPDKDGDGIADNKDACPDEPGTALMQGCPDRDGDGIADNKDSCPDKPGSLANNGCPDTDNDGITDDKDRCPTVPGTIANHGCPEIKAEVKKRLAFAATAIQFETGKAIIKFVSFKLLDEIVQILNDYPDYSMKIVGHTDNVGKPAGNLILSRGRAAAVKAYFMSKGIAASRLFTDGFGDTKPAASNKTAAGRAKNRRVAMTLFLPEESKK